MAALAPGAPAPAAGKLAVSEPTRAQFEAVRKVLASPEVERVASCSVAQEGQMQVITDSRRSRDDPQRSGAIAVLRREKMAAT
jgi:hypothetical protein